MILDSVIAALVSRFDTAVTVDVYDGPIPTAVNKGDFVLVGSTGEDDDGAAIDRELSPTGPGTWFEETGEVVCSVWSWSGNTDLAARRTAALANADACIAAIDADRSLGGVLVGSGITEITAIRYRPRQTNEGAIVRFTFSVLYRHLDT